MQVIVTLDFVIQSCINLALTHIFSFSFIRFFSKRDRYLMRNYFRMRYVSKSLLGCNDKGECGAKPRCRLDFNLLIMFGPSSFTRAFEIESPSPTPLLFICISFSKISFCKCIKQLLIFFIDTYSNITNWNKSWGFFQQPLGSYYDMALEREFQSIIREVHYYLRYAVMVSIEIGWQLIARQILLLVSYSLFRLVVVTTAHNLE